MCPQPLKPTRILPLKNLRRHGRKEAQTVCFTHRLLQKQCHCTGKNTQSVSSAARIPAKDDIKGWKEFHAYLFGCKVWRFYHHDLIALPKPGKGIRRSGRYVPAYHPGEVPVLCTK